MKTKEKDRLVNLLERMHLEVVKLQGSSFVRGLAAGGDPEEEEEWRDREAEAWDAYLRVVAEIGDMVRDTAFDHWFEHLPEEIRSALGGVPKISVHGRS